MCCFLLFLNTALSYFFLSLCSAAKYTKMFWYFTYLLSLSVYISKLVWNVYTYSELYPCGSENMPASCMRVVRCIKTIRNITQYTLNILSNTSTYSNTNTNTYKDPSIAWLQNAKRLLNKILYIYARFVFYVWFGWMAGWLVVLNSLFTNSSK